MGLLQQFPTEIESDISLYHGRDIADWWQGEMSSRWLHARIVHLPDDSATKTAMREGDWTEDRYLYARIVNELAYMRADQAALAGQKMRPQPILSPAQRREKDEQRQFRRDLHDMLLAQMTGQFVPPKRDVAFVADNKIPEKFRKEG